MAGACADAIEAPDPIGGLDAFIWTQETRRIVKGYR
jgi:hypothetical protein